MDEFFKWLSSNPVAATTLIVSFSVLVTSATLIYLVAFFQGREISFWPPKIGERPISASTPTSPTGTKPTSVKEPFERIDFNYQDSPVQHGWTLWEVTDETQPIFKHIPDGFFGTALEIQQRDRYAMDYSVRPETGLGAAIELAARFEKDACFFALVQVQSKDASQTRDLWLAFVIGNQSPKLIDDGSRWGYEWLIYIAPNRREGNWLLFQINLKDTVLSLAEREGWQYDKLKGFRVRGNLSLARISVFD